MAVFCGHVYKVSGVAHRCTAEAGHSTFRNMFGHLGPLREREPILNGHVFHLSPESFADFKARCEAEPDPAGVEKLRKALAKGARRSPIQQRLDQAIQATLDEDCGGYP